MATEGQDRAARIAAERAEAMVVEMLTLGQTGEVVILVTALGLEPEKRVVTKGKRVRIRDEYALIETVS